MTDVYRELVAIAKAFETAIYRSASAEPGARPGLTADAVRSLTEALAKVAKHVDGDRSDGEAARKHLRECLAELCARGPLWSRALRKPNGYAGDYALLDAIYQGKFVAPDPVGQELDRMFLTAPLAETVRARKDVLVDTLLSELAQLRGCRVRFTDLACGPCRDVEQVLQQSDGAEVFFYCVDHDRAALDYAAGILRPHLGTRVELAQGNVLRMKADGELGTEVSSVYSVGLIDYVPDRLASLAMRTWWKLVSPGGFLLLTVKDRDFYDPTLYDWMADWTFVPRTEKSFLSLIVETLGVAKDQIRVTRDRTGTSVQALVRKP